MHVGANEFDLKKFQEAVQEAQDENQVELHKLLKKHNVDSLPLRLRHSRTLGGSFHCITTDIHREN